MPYSLGESQSSGIVLPRSMLAQRLPVNCKTRAFIDIEMVGDCM